MYYFDCFNCYKCWQLIDNNNLYLEEGRLNYEKGYVIFLLFILVIFKKDNKDVLVLII